jgi:plasmid rolling circle replication initiator protein Rep
VKKIEFTNDILTGIKAKKEYNDKYSMYYFKLSKEYSDLKIREKRLKNKSDRLKSCMNLWIWDKYERNKILDLQKVNRCMDNRFCPNCRRFSLASAIHNFAPEFKKLLDDGYYPYLMTLTIPNVPGIDLKSTIEKMNKAFTKFYYYFSKDDKHKFRDRFIKFEAALKVLEITCNNNYETYHPHFHIMLFSKQYDESIFDKKYLAEYSNKRCSSNYISEFDIQIRKLWYMAYNSISQDQYSVVDDSYICDIREMDERGIYEVMKYTFKDTDIKNYENFKYIFLGIEGKRIRQGYGKLYNCKVEEDAEGEKQGIEEYLDVDKEETPEQLLTQELDELITVYHDYKKISRFKNYEDFSKLD